MINSNTYQKKTVNQQLPVNKKNIIMHAYIYEEWRPFSLKACDVNASVSSYSLICGDDDIYHNQIPPHRHLKMLQCKRLLLHVRSPVYPALYLRLPPPQTTWGAEETLHHSQTECVKQSTISTNNRENINRPLKKKIIATETILWIQRTNLLHGTETKTKQRTWNVHKRTL